MKQQTKKQVEFKMLVSKEESTWLKEADWRHANKAWLDRSFSIALQTLATMKCQGMSKKELGIKMNMTEDQVNAILSGNSNLTLKDIATIEKAFNFRIIV